MKVVISQPMLFPWVGMLEQIALADVYVHYADVPFSKGGFSNRVQIKTAHGMRWMTVPLDRLHLGQKINEVRMARQRDWRSEHLSLLRASFDGLPYAGDAISMVENVYALDADTIATLSAASMEALASYFGLAPVGGFMFSQGLAVEHTSSRRVLDIVHAVGGTHYLTGHGARNYLDHEMFEAEGVSVDYMDYEMRPYAQAHGPFTPYVSALDLVANLGRCGREYICSGAVGWRKFVGHG